MLKITDNEAMTPPQVIPTPSLRWNNLLGGGLWTDRIHTIWGNPGGGKSTVAAKILANGQEMGFKPVIFDSEGAFTDPYLEKCGLDISNRIIYPHANILEDIQKEYLPMMRNQDEKYIFLFDSINGIIKEAFFKDDEKHGGMALAARTQQELMLKTSGFLHPNCMVILISQQQMDLSGTVAMLKGKFGNAVEHYSTNIIKVFASNSAKTTERFDDGTIEKREILWKIDKCKQAPVQGASGEYNFYPNEAHIDTKDEIIDLAGEYGIIDTTSKGWYGYKGEKLRKTDLYDALDEEEFKLIIDTIESINAGE